MKIKIMLVDDHKMVSEILGTFLEREEDMEVVAIAENGREAISKAREVNPDIIAMDVVMPEMNGLEACRRIKAEAPEIRIIVLSMYSGKEHVVDAFKAGASGYILKDSTFKELAGAIRSVAGKNGYLDPKISDVDICEQLQHPHEPDSLNGQKLLTAREREVLRLMAEGETYREIANTLDISTKTVESHRRHISRKLRLSNVADLTRYAIKEGIISL
jgi:DNA-binding NarL/FixJ family response regulator